MHMELEESEGKDRWAGQKGEETGNHGKGGLNFSTPTSTALAPMEDLSGWRPRLSSPQADSCLSSSERSAEGHSCSLPRLSPQFPALNPKSSSLGGQSHLPKEGGSLWNGNGSTSWHQTCLSPQGPAGLPSSGASWYFKSGGSHAAPAKAGFVLSI